MDGDVAKLRKLLKIAEEFDLITYVDDAQWFRSHGKGVLELVHHFGLS